MRLGSWLVLLVVSGSTAVSTESHAQVALRLHEVDADDVRVDGMLRDWRGLRRVQVGRGNDASFAFVLGYDASGLYVAAAVKDERVLRTGPTADDQDAIVITLAMPTRRGFQGSELWLFPGVEGRMAGAAAIGPIGRRTRAIPDARVVEARTRDGFELEAYVPWSRIPGGRLWERGAHAALRYHDVDSEARPTAENSPATMPVDPGNLDRLAELSPTGGEHAILERFLQVKDLRGTRPSHDLRGNVCGDARPERVVHVDRYIVVMGPGYRDANQFDYVELPVSRASDVIDARLRDFTGDGQRELFTRLRQRGEGGTRDLWQLFTFDCQSVEPLFGVEIRKETSDGHVESRVHVRGGTRSAPTIEVSVGEASGLTPSNFRERPSTDAHPILLPWGPTLAQSYRWDGRRFAVIDERPNPNPYTPPSERPATMEREPQVERESPPPSSADLLAAVRRERRIPRGVRERFAVEANLAGDRRAERLVVLGKAVVVVGPGFRNGRGYFYYEIQVADADDIVSVETADLNGDGRREILVRAKQGLDDITRELLMVHRFTRDGSFPRVYTAEVARTQGDNRIENEVRTRGGRLEIRPGRARGWSADNWPWSDAGGGEGIDPLLLPWTDRARRPSL